MTSSLIFGGTQNQAGVWRGSATGPVVRFWPSWPEVPGWLVRKKGNKKRANTE